MSAILENSGKTTESKNCCRCLVDLPKSTEHFYQYGDGRYSSYCRSCDSIRGKKWKKDNKDRVKELNRKYMNTEHHFIRSTLKRIYKPSTINPKQYKGSYQRKGWNPEITVDELYAELLLHIQIMKDKFPESDGRLCRYCDQPWTYVRQGKEFVKRETTWTNFSLDRFDPRETYKKGNIIFCCSKCNSLKNGSTKEMWIRFLEIDKELNETK